MLGKCQFLWGRLAVRYCGNYFNYFEESIKPARNAKGNRIGVLPQHLLAQVSGLVGAGAWHFWRRCGKRGGDLRQRSAREAISRRRSPAENHTCAMDRHHLRPEPPSPAPGITVTCAGNNHHFRHCCRNWSEQPTGNELVGVVLSLGAGIGSCWCRCLAFVGAGAWHFWRRCGKRGVTCANGAHERPFRGAGPLPKTTPAPEIIVTCAANSHHLRQDYPPPALSATCIEGSGLSGCFRKATPGSRRGILRRSRGWRGGRCGCRRSSGR